MAKKFKPTGFCRVCGKKLENTLGGRIYCIDGDCRQKGAQELYEQKLLQKQRTEMFCGSCDNDKIFPKNYKYCPMCGSELQKRQIDRVTARIEANRKWAERKKKLFGYEEEQTDADKVKPLDLTE